MSSEGINRRQFVGTAALTAAGLFGAAPDSAQAQAEAPGRQARHQGGPVQHHVSGRLVPGQGTRLWSRWSGKAKEYGYDGIEIDGKRPHGNPNDWPTKRCKELRSLADGEGIEIYAVAGNNDFSSPDLRASGSPDRLHAGVDPDGLGLGGPAVRAFFAWPGVTKHPQIASYTIARNIWNHTHSLTTSADDGSRCRDALAECARYAADYGVTLALQNHAPIVTSYKDVLRMIQEVNSPQLEGLPRPAAAVGQEPGRHPGGNERAGLLPGPVALRRRVRPYRRWIGRQ